MINYNITLSANNAVPVDTGIVLKSGDKGITLNYKINELDLDSATKARFVFYRANGTSVEYETDTVSEEMEYVVQGNELAVPGKTIADVKFYDADDNRISSTSFAFEVSPDTLDGIGEGAGGYSDRLEELTEELEETLDYYQNAFVPNLKAEIDNRIKKFYTSNLVSESVSDSDDGAIRDLIIYGKSSQGENPSPDNPQTIHSVVNPSVKIVGKNLFEEVGQRNGYYDRVSDNTFRFQTSSKTKTFDSVFVKSGTYTLSWTPNNPSAVTSRYWFVSDLPISNNNARCIQYLSYTNNASSITITINNDGYFTVGLDANATNIQLEKSPNATPYKPYEYTTASLSNLTLNAIPVSTGGNVTINGQQYIADYVDIARKKVVRLTNSKRIPSTFEGRFAWSNSAFLSIGIIDDALNVSGYSTKANLLCTHAITKKPSDVATGNYHGSIGQGADNYLFFDLGADITTIAAAQNFFANNNVRITYQLATPTETDLTDEQIVDFLVLRSYYGTTNATVTSDDINGASEFLYPCSIENFVEYVKEQMGDTREFIYDISDISEQAFINAQYAEVMLELSE